MLYFLIKNIIPYLSYNVINETNKKFFLGGENFVYNLQGFIEKYVIFSNKYYKFQFSIHFIKKNQSLKKNSKYSFTDFINTIKQRFNVIFSILKLFFKHPKILFSWYFIFDCLPF